MRSAVILRIGMLAFGLLCSCSFNKAEHPAACRQTADCGRGQACYKGFCIQDGRADAGKIANADGGSTTTDSGSSQTGKRCVEGQPPESCYDGADGTADVGICKTGQRACVGGVYTQCLGQVLPAAETCNGKDDDCNGKTDEIEMGDCETRMQGICNVGQLMCRGTYAVCEATNPPVEEQCNGDDDDCDGKTDEVTSSACYPAGTDGCTTATDGSTACVGRCRQGMTECNAGKSTCANPVTPVDEACTIGAATAADEDCDGNIDEGCACTNGQSRPCYAGPDGTESKGACHAGTQLCTANIWGNCVGQVLPQPESCSNQGVDDDCDGTRDDVPGLGHPCIDDNNKGICRDGTVQCAGSLSMPMCVTASPTQELCDPIDQDCDGDPYNGYDLNTDRNNCGSCGTQCTSKETCCAGRCIAFAALQMDEKNCGQCGNVCGAGQLCCQGKCVSSGKGGGGLITFCQCSQSCGSNSCCGTQCVDLSSDAYNCGACGNDCTSGGQRKLRCCSGTCALLCVGGL